MSENVEDVKGFWFRPPRDKNEIVPDEGGWAGVHIERLSATSYWMGVENQDGEKCNFYFYIGSEKVENEEGEMVYPLLLRAEIDTE
jgi:hypothetical protein